MGSNFSCPKFKKFKKIPRILQRGLQQLAGGHGGGPPVRLAAQRNCACRHQEVDPGPADWLGVPPAGQVGRPLQHLVHRRRNPQNREPPRLVSKCVTKFRRNLSAWESCLHFNFSQ